MSCDDAGASDRLHYSCALACTPSPCSTPRQKGTVGFVQPFRPVRACGSRIGHVVWSLAPPLLATCCLANTSDRLHTQHRAVHSLCDAHTHLLHSGSASALVMARTAAGTMIIAAVLVLSMAATYAQAESSKRTASKPQHALMPWCIVLCLVVPRPLLTRCVLAACPAASVRRVPRLLH